MAPKNRRGQLAAFNLSFLDIMFCGFGAVVLLVLIVHSQTVRNRNERHKDLLTEAARLSQEVEVQERLLSELKNSLEELDQERVRMEGASQELLSEIERTREETARYLRLSLAKKEHADRLKSDLKSMDQIKRRQLSEMEAERDQGRKALKFTGQGHRQYLTGLRLGGRRVLILVDGSASMLDESVVGIIRRRNMPKSQMLRSRKWRQTVRTVRWLLANLPLNSSVRVGLFNTKVEFLGESGTRWIGVKESKGLQGIMEHLATIAPSGGTNLYLAFSRASAIDPGPDNIILLTDGLPTIGRRAKRAGKVSSNERVRLFKEAAEALGGHIPVNTLLFPLEGDPMAPSLYWRLAVRTGGSFLTPARDWP